jgi:hypothetical protein
MIFHSTEAGADDLGGLGELLGIGAGAALESPGVQRAAQRLVISTLDDPEVRSALVSAARPVALESAAYVTLSVALLMVIWKGL